MDNIEQTNPIVVAKEEVCVELKNIKWFLLFRST